MATFDIDLDAVRFRAAELGNVRSGLEGAGAALPAADIAVVEAAGEFGGVIDGDSGWACQQWRVGHGNVGQAVDLIAREMLSVAENALQVDRLAAADVSTPISLGGPR